MRSCAWAAGRRFSAWLDKETTWNRSFHSTWLSERDGRRASAQWAAPHAAHYYPYANYAAGSQPPPQLAAFEPDELGARLDPRRFKFAPRFAMASVMPAGLRSVRRDNLVVG